MHNLNRVELVSLLVKAIEDGVAIKVESITPNVTWSGDVEALKEVHDRIQQRMQINLPDSVDKLRK